MRLNRNAVTSTVTGCHDGFPSNFIRKTRPVTLITVTARNQRGARWDALDLRAANVRPPPNASPPPDLAASPLYLLAVLFAARRSKDRALERMTRQRLDSLGVRITFGDELPARNGKAKGGGHG